MWRRTPSLALLCALAMTPVLEGLRVAEQPVRVAQREDATQKRANASLAQPEKRILVFWAVGHIPYVVTLVKQNIQKFRSYEKSTGHSVKFDVFLAHYDGRRQDWVWGSSGDLWWYGQNIKHGRNRQGLKMFLAKEFLVDKVDPEVHVDLSSYDWIWFLDEDADLSITNLDTLLEDAETSGSMIVSPSIKFMQDFVAPVAAGLMREEGLDRQRSGTGCAKGDAKCNFEAPGRCRYRYVNFLETTFPLIRPVAFEALAKAPHVVAGDSVWGLDHVWCALSAKLTSIGDNKTSCAIVDEAPAVHRDFRTEPKYDHIDQLRQVEANRWAKHRLRVAYPEEFCPDDHIATHQCI